MAKKNKILPHLVILFLFISTTAYGGVVNLVIDDVKTTDLLNRSKKEFSFSDKIRFSVNYSVPLPSVVFARGKVKYEGAKEEILVLQFKKVRAGEHSFFWDSSVPQKSEGDASVDIKVFSIPGLFENATASFAVKLEEDNDNHSDETFIGTASCIMCHAGLNPDIVASFQESGHQNTLKFVGGSTPDFPDFSPGVPEPPSTFQWKDIRYVIGGYAWNAFFVNQEGSILTTGTDGVNTQYNLPNIFSGTDSYFETYEADNKDPKVFDCASCHTTGYSKDGHKDGLSQIIGTWNEENIGCEACHGPGSAHQRNPSAVAPPLDQRESCSRCHIRDNIEIIEAEDGLILHNQQYEELISAGKSFFRCNSCHNPHASAHYDLSAEGEAVVQECISCHQDKTIGIGMQDLNCCDCHMPFAVSSGSHITFKDSEGNSLVLGDMRSHIFKINIEAGTPSDMFTDNGSSVATGDDGRVLGLTLNFVCQGCHREGGTAQRPYAFEQLKVLAGAVHPSVSQ